MAEGLSYPEIAAAASPERPLVYLLTTSWGSLAVIVTAGSDHLGSEQVVWLDGFSSEAMDGLLVERDPSGGVSGGYLVGQVGGDLDMLGSALGRVLPLLGEKLLGPLTRTLGDLGMAGATLVTVGRLSLLPLPAAAEGLTYSLAPSARALRAARDAAADRAGLAPLLVAVGNPLPVPEGQAPLYYAAEEVAAIAPFFEPGSRRLLAEDQATLEGVTHGLAGATHLHLACHGSFHHDQPLDSVLHLAGGERITLGNLLDGDLDLSTAHLAVLSACQTGITEFDRIPDEAVGLPAGFLQAGVPGVVATLWSVNDLSTALLMAEFYRLLLTEHLDPATALRQARRWLGDSTAADLDLPGWFDRRHQTSGWTDLAALDTARYYRAHPDEQPFANPIYWAGFTYSGP
jgi:CHAT domain-containing protein